MWAFLMLQKIQINQKPIFTCQEESFSFHLMLLSCFIFLLLFALTLQTFWKLFIYSSLAVRGLRCCMGSSLVVSGRDYSAPACRLLTGVASLVAQTPGHTGFRSYGTCAQHLSFWFLESRLNCCGPQALNVRGRPGSGIERVPPALAGRFFTTVSPGKSHHKLFLKNYSACVTFWKNFVSFRKLPVCEDFKSEFNWKFYFN